MNEYVCVYECVFLSHVHLNYFWRDKHEPDNTGDLQCKEPQAGVGRKMITVPIHPLTLDLLFLSLPPGLPGVYPLKGDQSSPTVKVTIETLLEPSWQRFKTHRIHGLEPPQHSPDSATSEMGTPCSWDMKPRMEKMANPATKLVPLLRKQRAMQSLWGVEEVETGGSKGLQGLRSEPMGTPGEPCPSGQTGQRGCLTELR